ncbi:MAG: VWA domain-containing protein [Bacteroidetes bacterium]|nr:MAG: VWA domain-containing protein [Bacteroidota bacterium]
MFRFAHISFLYLLALIPVFTVLLVLFLVWRKKALNRFGEFHLIHRLIPEFSTGRLIFKFVLLMISFAFLVLALADPQTGSKMEKYQRKGIDVMIALDVSNSMLAEDIRPSRLERAKQSISKLIDRLDGDRIGIIVFAGKAYNQLPITTDYGAAKMFLSAINTNIVPVQGTAIADAIDMATGAFGQSIHNKAIIVISDGEDHQGDVLEKTEVAAKKGIVFYAVGMGIPEGGPIPVYNGDTRSGYKKDRDGSTIITRLDESLLQRIASLGKGMYVRANNSEEGWRKVFDDLNKIEKSELESRQFSDYEDRFQYFIGFSLLFLIFELFVFDKKNQWFSRFKPF